ncbi:hypothetical protein CYMTET_5796 [Cymbomonas tetramitiformis]|uniref:Methyltransferase-like protein 22 n=1 Tax=Cymbomonas tetramitiformis TaxID=36881 RepID=A0AAE0GYT7_9CHLO|nr:hypothetical protein CYMTET_5796 [Cymbomonas tetramitiformis]
MEKVLSEVHLELRCSEETTITRFDFRSSSQSSSCDEPSSSDPEEDLPRGRHVSKNIRLDNDGDIKLRRGKKKRRVARSLSICHSMSTPLASVGLQVWRGALLFAEFVLQSQERFHGAVVLELGGGTGLVGALLAPCARHVFVTDIGEDILKNCARNIEENRHLSQGGVEHIQVRELDWRCPLERPVETSSATFQWGADDLRRMKNLSYLVAADCVYDEPLTDTLFSCVKYLFRAYPSCRSLFVSLEKRVNFSLVDLQARAHAYDHFRTHFTAVEPSQHVPIDVPVALDHAAPMKLLGRQISCDTIGQAFDYDRTCDLELWEIFVDSTKESCAVVEAK